MKKSTKILLIILAILAAILTTAFVCADIIVSRLVQKEVAKAMEAAPGCEARCGDIHIRFFSGTASVHDLYFFYRGEPVSPKDTIGPGVRIAVERVDLGRVFYTALLKRRVLVSDLHIKNPQLELWMDEEHPETCFPELHDEHVEQMQNPMKSARLMKLAVKNASLRLHSVRTRLDVEADDFSCAVHDLAYDSVFSYNDSVYEITLGKAVVVLPDGRIRLETNGLSHSNQGALEIGTTRIAHTMARKRLGDIVKEPATWMDMTVASVTTSPFNPLRKAMNQDYSIESVKAVVERMNIFRDERYAPKEPFAMPQEILMAIPAVFRIGTVDAAIKKINIEFANTNISSGKLELAGIKTQVKNVSNAKNSTMVIQGTCPIREGLAEAGMTMTMNKDCNFTTKLHVTDVNIDYLNSFLRPLVGITCDLQVDTLDTEYAGDRTIAKGTFRMLYHGLKVQVHKEENIPYKIVTKNANTFTTLANSLLPKSNPTSVDIHPRAYQVEWKNDVWKPFPLYLFGPCIDGAVETLLPGLFVHKQVSRKKSENKKK